MNRSRFGRGIVAALSVSAALLLSVGTAQAENAQAEDIQTITDQYLFEISLDEFIEIRGEKPYPDQLDWSSDSCSWSPDEPLGYEFSTSCDRHDFGYRNYKNQERFNDDTRLKIDDHFKADMYSTCGDDSACKSAADVYYWAVRQFGEMSRTTEGTLDKAQVTRATTASGEVLEYRAVDRQGQPVEFRVD